MAIISKNIEDDKSLVNLGVSNLKVYAVDRKIRTGLSIDEYKNGTLVNNMTVMEEELIDLGDDSRTDDVEKYVSEMKGTQGSANKIITVRNQRPKERGLLLIHPIYTHWNCTEEEKKKLVENTVLAPIVSSTKELFGVTLVFPPTAQEQFEFDYIENATI